MISIIIPAYKAEKYIDECISSLTAVGVEILIGVDACETTLNHIINKGLYPDLGVSLFYFPKNVGPYVIKNTLIDIAKNDNVLFFDADDIMQSGTLEQFYNAIQRNDYVKLNYMNFQKTITKNGQIMNDAVIGVKKDVFNKLNGFYPWKCGADTEFGYRLWNNGFKQKTLEGINYFRRLHGENLTMRKDLGHGSAIRNQYCNIINNNLRNKTWPNPSSKTISEYVTY